MPAIHPTFYHRVCLVSRFLARVDGVVDHTGKRGKRVRRKLLGVKAGFPRRVSRDFKPGRFSNAGVGVVNR